MANIVIDIQEVEQDAAAEKLPGQRLREVRERRGLRLLEVAEALLLTEEQIKALEDNNFKVFPAPLFVSGYLRKYAALLEIPSEPLVEAFENIGMETPSLQAELTSSIPRPRRFNLELSAGIVVAVGVISLLLVWLSSTEEEMVSVTQDVASAQTVGAAAMPATQPPVVDLASGVPEEKVASQPPAAPANTAPRARVQMQVIPTPAEPPAPAASTSSVRGTGPDQLLLQFSADSWVEIRDARGERLFFNMGKAGETRLLQGQAPFDILLGNAPAVQIEYNGEPYSHKRFNRKNVARFKLGNGA